MIISTQKLEEVQQIQEYQKLVMTQIAVCVLPSDMMNRKVGRRSRDVWIMTRWNLRRRTTYISDRVKRFAEQKRYSIVAVCQSQLMQTRVSPSLRYLPHHCSHGRLVLPDKKPGATGLVLDAELPEALVTIVFANLQPGKEAHHAVHSKWGRDLPVPDIGASWDHLSKARVPAAPRRRRRIVRTGT
jgi:hypothetical protein